MNKIWTQQPQVPVQIDWSNPITRGLVDVINAADLRSVINKVPAVTTGAVDPGIASNGRVRRTPATGNNKDAYTGTWSMINVPLTLIAMYRITNAAYSSRIAGNLASSTYGYGIAPNTTNFCAIIARSGVNTILTGATVNTALKVDAITVDATNASFYENGKLTAGPTAHGGMATPTGDFTFGAENGASNTDAADYYLSALFNRVLSNSEIRSISNNPWQIFQPIERHIFLPIATDVAVLLYSRPSSDVSTVWTPSIGTSCADTISEVLADDDNYSYGNGTQDVNLGGITEYVAGHTPVLRYRIKNPTRVTLLQSAVALATWDHNNSSPETFQRTLPTNLITDYNSLVLRFESI